MKATIFFVIFLTFSVNVFSENNLLQNKPENSEEKVVSPPDPALLRPNWWNYYNVDHERLESRIQKTEKTLKNLQSDLSPQQHIVADPLIRQILIGLNNYRVLSAKKWTPPSIVFEPKERYTFDQFLELGEQLIHTQLKLKSQRLKIQIENANLRSDRSYLDTITAAYLSLPKSDPSRVVKGLTVMATKISVELDEQKLAELDTAEMWWQKQVEEMEKTVVFARKHIDASQLELTHLEQQVKQRQAQLAQSQESLLVFQTRFATIQDTSGSIQLLNQTLLRSIAEVSWIQATLKFMLGQILIHPEKRKAKDLYEELIALEENQFHIERELDDWEKAANHYLEITLADLQPHLISEAEKLVVMVQVIQNQSKLNDFLFEQTDQLIRINYFTLKDRITEYWHSVKANLKRYSKWAHVSLFKLGQAPITLYGIFKFLCTLLIAYFIAKFLQLWINKVGQKQKKIQRAGIYTLSRLLYYSIMILGVIIAISGIGLDFTTFAVIAGALSVGIGFGLQSIVNNFVSGVILLLEKKLRVSDYVQLETGEIGSVMEINVRTTLIKTFDNLEVLVPNADLVSKKFINWTLSDKLRRLRIPFGVAFGSDKEKIKAVIIEAALNVPLTVREKEPQVWHVGIGESSLDFELVVWVNEHLQGLPPVATKAIYTWEIESALRSNDIKIPFPVRDVKITETVT